MKEVVPRPRRQKSASPATYEVIKGIRVPLRKTLVKFLSIAGLHRRDAENIADLFLKWCHSNGPEWTNSRWKELRMWYEQWLGGNSQRPGWFATNRKGEPKGPLNAIFKLEPERALLALSINTMLMATEPTAQQLEKVDKGFGGNGFIYTSELSQRIKSEFAKARPKRRCHRKFKPNLRLIDVSDLEGRATVPFAGESKKTSAPTKFAEIPHADELWKATLIEGQYLECPECCLEFLWDSGCLDYLPISAIGNEHQLDLNHCTNIVGKGFILQEEQIKPRFGVSYNALVQVCLEPLGRLWWDTLSSMSFTKEGVPGENQDIAQSCYLCQDKGREWVRNTLRDGKVLAGIDLTSATDLLSLEACLDVVNTVWFSDLADNDEYKRHLRLFKEVSRSPFLWSKGVRSYQQGWPLGTYPSFALLSLTMMAIMRLSLIESECEPNCHMNLGDDAILDARAIQVCTDWVRKLGGEVNLSKTLTSGKAAEFAGRVITPDRIMRKAVKVDASLTIGDDSFMDLMACLGEPGKALLLPRQRRCWDVFKYVPGVILGDSWSRDGYGAPLAKRYQWYLEHVKQLKPEPDKERELDAAERQLRLRYLLGLTMEDISTTLPEPFLERDYPSLFKAPIHGDPRHGGANQTLLKVLEGWLASGLLDYPTWEKSQGCSDSVTYPNEEKEAKEAPAFGKVCDTAHAQ